MASSTQHCAINDCKRPCRALCLCCDQYLCRDHLNEHDTLINAQIPLLMDQLNSLSDQFNRDDGSEFVFLKDIEQWRENAHRTVDQFYERKLQQRQQVIQIKRSKQKKEFDRMKLNFNELVQQQEATKQQIDSMKQSIEFFEHELQMTPIIKGRTPEYNFTAQYIVNVDDFLLYYLQKEYTLIELHQTVGQSFQTVAACKLSLKELIEGESSESHS